MDPLEKHNKTKLAFELYGITISGELQDFNRGWAEWSDNQKIEVIKSLIFTAPDMRKFQEKVLRAVTAIELD